MQRVKKITEISLVLKQQSLIFYCPDLLSMFLDDNQGFKKINYVPKINNCCVNNSQPAKGKNQQNMKYVIVKLGC